MNFSNGLGRNSAMLGYKLKLINLLQFIMLAVLIVLPAAYAAAATTNSPAIEMDDRSPPSSQLATNSYNYKYYPDQQVYYDTGNHVYFYQAGRRWRRVSRLPRSIDLHSAKSIDLSLGTHQPYRFINRHKRTYPPRAVHQERRPVKRDYWYYPASKVYYDDNRRLYFYKKHNRWQQSNRLPSDIHVNRSYRKRLTMNTLQPYKNHHKHVQRYPAKKNRRENRRSREH